MSLSIEHHISNGYLTGREADGDFGQHGRRSAVGLAPSLPCVPAKEINRVRSEPEQGVSALNEYLWAGDGI